VGALQINGNASLKNLQGIALRQADAVTIDANPVLADLTGLENLASIASSLSIVQNGSLGSLRALGGLMSVLGLEVVDNRRLPAVRGRMAGQASEPDAHGKQRSAWHVRAVS
jgi:hypothetical protein